MYRKFLRPGWIFGHLMVVLAVLVCLRLGWWQWDRTHDPDGTVQNLGYAILWPVFGAAFIYMWVRFLQLELLKDAEDDAELTELAAGADRPPESAGPSQNSADQNSAAQARADQARADQASAAQDGGNGDIGDHDQAQTDLTSVDVGSQVPQPVADDARPAEPATEPTDAESRSRVAGPALSANRPSRGVTVAVSTVGDEMQDQDPELAAYNRALAALAEKDHRRAR